MNISTKHTLTDTFVYIFNERNLLLKVTGTHIHTAKEQKYLQSQKHNWKHTQTKKHS